MLSLHLVCSSFHSGSPGVFRGVLVRTVKSTLLGERKLLPGLVLPWTYLDPLKLRIPGKQQSWALGHAMWEVPTQDPMLA